MGLKINILISTLDSGIKNLNNVILEPRSDVEYIVSHQFTDVAYRQIPDFLNRDDVTISHIPGKGVTISRNNAIRLAEGDVGLFADDDVTYTHSYFDTLAKVFESNHELDVALFKIKTPEGDPEYKNYSLERKKILKAPSVGTVEIGFRVKSVKKNKLFFDERFGAGQELLIGSDEKIFIQDCLKAGLNVEYFPEYIVEHPYESTVNTIPKYDKRKIWVTGGYDCRTNGIIAVPKAMLGTLKYMPDLLKNGINPLFYLFNRLSAVFYIIRTNKY